MQQNVEPSDIFLQPFNSVIRNFTGSCSQCFEASTALSLSLMLSFYRINVEPISAKSEKSSYYQRLLSEELLRTFSFGHHSRQSSE